MVWRESLLLILVTFVWGLNFIVIKLGLSTLPPLLFLALRFLVCAAPVLFGVRRPAISLVQILLLGSIFGVGVFGCLFLGIYFGMPAGLASVAMQSQVFFTIIIALIFLKERITRMAIVAIGCGVAGMVLLLVDDVKTSTALGMSCILLGALCWGAFNNLLKTHHDIPMFDLLTWISLVPIAPFLLASFLFENPLDALAVNLNVSSIFAIFYTSIISTLFAYYVWGSLIQKHGSVFVAPFALLIPVFGILLSYLIFREQINNSEIIGMSLIFIGLIINNIQNYLRLKSDPSGKKAEESVRNSRQQQGPY